MSYFESFPKTLYEFNGDQTVVTDIFRRLQFDSIVKDSAGLFRTYTVLDEERPEHVAKKFYGNENMHWIILLYNEMIDPNFDWPLSDVGVEDYCKRVYGNPTLFQVRHYEKNGLIIGEYYEYDFEDPNFAWFPPVNPGPNDPTIYPVSHLEFEKRLNDRKREIKILKPEVLPLIFSEFKVAINA